MLVYWNQTLQREVFYCFFFFFPLSFISCLCVQGSSCSVFVHGNFISDKDISVHAGQWRQFGAGEPPRDVTNQIMLLHRRSERSWKKDNHIGLALWIKPAIHVAAPRSSEISGTASLLKEKCVWLGWMFVSHMGEICFCFSSSSPSSLCSFPKGWVELQITAVECNSCNSFLSHSYLKMAAHTDGNGHLTLIKR